MKALFKTDQKTAQERNLNIFLLNLDQTTEKTLTYYFDSSLCASISLANSYITADLYIIDCQRKFDSSILKNINNSRIFAVLLYANNCDFKDSENIALLKKPIDIATLESKISHVKKQLFSQTQNNVITPKKSMIEPKSLNKIKNSQLFRAVSDETEQDFHPMYTGQKYVGANANVDKNNSKSKKIFITIEDYLFYHLQKCKCMATTIQSNVLIKHSLGNIFYNLKEQTFNHSFNECQLKYLQSSPIKHSIEIIPTSIDVTSTTSENDNNFIWKSAIQASKGRIPKSIDIHSAVKIKSWPNFSQLQMFDYAVRIVAVWSKYRLSLYDTAERLQIPQRYVFTLYCAMNSLGQVKVDNKLTQNHSIKASSNKTSLFAKVLSHMFAKKSMGKYLS